MSLEGIPNGSAPSEAFKKRRVAIVEMKGALEEEARDVADERLTASKEELRGVKGFCAKIWKHNLFREYYRQKEISKSKSEILNSGNLYAGEGARKIVHDEAMEAVVDRFVSEYEEVIHTEAGEERKIVTDESTEDARLNQEVRALIREYASGAIDDETFNAERGRIISYATNFNGDDLSAAITHTDNLLEIAREARLAVEHGAALEQIDSEIEIVVGKAKIGVRTEANFNTVDKIIAKVQSTKIGRLLNETTIASGVAIAYATTIGLSERLARSKAFTWGTFGAAALIGGAIAGLRENAKVKEERAKGKVIDDESERREEMEESRYATVEAASLIGSLSEMEGVPMTNEIFFKTINLLAQAESRVELSDRERIDLIAYSNVATIEEERFRLDVLRAETKIRLRNTITHGDVQLPKDQTFEHILEAAVTHEKGELRTSEEGMEAKDKIFNAMKRKKVAGAVVKAVVTGVAVGGIVQEAAAFMSDKTEGLVEHFVSPDASPGYVTSLEAIRQYIGGEGVSSSGVEETVVAGKHVKLPPGIEITANADAKGTFIFTRDGEVVSDQITFTSTGHPTPESIDILRKEGVTTSVETRSIETQGVGTSEEFAEKNQELFSKIERKFWYDNNTKVFDKNELKLHWGGEKGSGIDANGNYVFNIAKMTQDGSTFKNLSIDAQETMKSGKMKLLLSLSRESQSSVVEVPIDANGNAIIDPNSKIGKAFFQHQNGKLTFVGKFAEIAHEAGVGKSGAKQFEILATHVGSGVPNLPTVIREDTPITSFGTGSNVLPPPFIPLFGRTPMEPMRKRAPGGADHFPFPYGYNGGVRSIRKSYEERMSDSLRNNPDATLDEKNEIRQYLARQEKEHQEDIAMLADEAGEMNPECKLSVCIPAAGHQEGKSIYRTLENYAHQTADKDSFEIVIFVNHPDKDRLGYPITPDETYEEIQRFQKDHPDMHVRVMRKVIPSGKAKIGYLRKLLNDTVLQRNLSRGSSAPDHIIVSNDADNKGIAKEYIQNFLDKFDGNPDTEAFMGQLDWDPESYTKNPLIHIGTRLFQYVDIQLRAKDPDDVASSGANFAFRSGIYAAINGYNPASQMAEDVDLGRAIKAARMGARNKKAIRYAGTRVSRLFTSSRRAEKAIKDGLAPIEQWNKGFSAFDDEVRKTNWGALNRAIDFSKPEEVGNLVENLEYVMNRTIQAMTWGHEDLKVFKRALGWLGVTYTMNSDRTIKIIDASKLIEGIKTYQTEAGEIVERKTKGPAAKVAAV